MLRGREGDARKATERMSFIIVLLIDMFVLLGRSFGCRIGKRGVLCCLWLMFLRTEVTKRMVETPRLISLVCCAGINIDGVLDVCVNAIPSKDMHHSPSLNNAEIVLEIS
ncbi:hypothetical protein NC651_024201 [Populus alba x Populus x berolinensis]|nr:hypothetical protein NC651_024201 [Populus alba x Populus x berolinensis]